MPIFSVTYYDRDRKIKTLEFEQKTEEDVLTYLKRQGIVPISIKKQKGKRRAISFFKRQKKLSTIEKENMTRHLATLVRIGTPLFESIELMSEGTTNPKMIRIYKDMLATLEEGKLFSSVFEKYPDDFPANFSSVVRVGEATGTLDQSFALLSEQLEKQRTLQKAIRSATIYPIVLSFAVIALIALVLFFVVPRISQVFGSLGTELPATTKFLVNTSEFMTKNPFAVISILVLFFIAIILARKPVKNAAIKVITIIPGIRRLIQAIRLAQMARNLATMVKSGISLIQALETEADGMRGTPYQKALNDVANDVRKGITLTNSMKKRPELFPNMFVGMMRVGEKTATLDQILGHMADFYEEEADTSLKNLSSFVEPVLLLVIGGIILFIAMSVLIPIYSLVSEIV